MSTPQSTAAVPTDRPGGPASSAGGVPIDEMTLAGTLRDLGRFDAAMGLGHRVADAMRAAGHAHWAVNTENAIWRWPTTGWAAPTWP